MSVYWNRRTSGLSPYVPGEQPRDRKFIKLNTNENPYPPSPRVIAAIEQALAATGQTGAASAGVASAGGLPAGERLRLYPDPLCAEFREAVAAAYGVKPAQVFPGNGSDEVLGFAFGAFFESAEDSAPVLFPDITYSFYPVYAALWGIPFTTIPLDEDFSIDLERYAIPNGGVVIANPNAPTGRALPAPPLLDLARKLQQDRRVLIVDEAYTAFGAESLVPHIGDHPNLLTVHTLSKSASLAGFRIGFAIGSEELIDGLFRVRDSFNSYTMDALALAGGAAAVLDSAYYNAINQKIIATRERTATALTLMGFQVIPSKANFLFISGGPVSTAQSHSGSTNAPAPPRSGPQQIHSPGGTPCYLSPGHTLTGSRAVPERPPRSSPACLSRQAGLRSPGISGPALFQALRDRGILVRHFNKPRIADYLRVSMGRDEDMDAVLTACREIMQGK